MARYSYEIRYDAQGVIDFEYYRAKARTERKEARAHFLRRMVAFISGKRMRLAGKTRIACLSY